MALFSQQQPSFSTFAKATGGRYDPTTPSGQARLRQDYLDAARRNEDFRNAASAVVERQALEEIMRPSEQVAPGVRAVRKDGQIVGYSKPIEPGQKAVFKDLPYGATSLEQVGEIARAIPADKRTARDEALAADTRATPFQKGFLAALQKAQPAQAAPAKPAEQVTETVTEKVTEKPVTAQAPVEKPAAPTPKPMSFAEAAKQAMGKAEAGQKATAAEQANTRMQQLQALVSTLKDPAQIEKAASDYAEAEAQAALNTMSDEELQQYAQQAMSGAVVKGQGFLGSLGSTLEGSRLAALDMLRNAGSGISSSLFGGTPAKPSREMLEYLVKQAAKVKAMQALGQQPAAILPTF